MRQIFQTPTLWRAAAVVAILTMSAGGASSALAQVKSYGRNSERTTQKDAPGPKTSGNSQRSVSEARDAAKSRSEARQAAKSEKTKGRGQSGPSSQQPARPKVQSFTRSSSTDSKPVSFNETPEPMAEGLDAFSVEQNATPEPELEAGARASGIPYLVPGNGFHGPTPEPARIGDLSAPGARAKAIAHWDMIPEMMISGDYQVGVVAFHINGIDRVEFSLNGGPWLAARGMSENKITGVWEYMVRLSASDLPDGLFELRAIAYPTVGQPRLLEPLTLIANRGGTVPQGTFYVSPNGDDVNGDGSKQRPFKTMYHAARMIEREHGAPYFASNGHILLLEGDHLFAGRPQGNPRVQTPMGWLNIQAAPGLDKSRVRIVGNSDTWGGLCAARVKFTNITVVSTSLKTDTAYAPMAWLDRCDLIGKGPGDLTRFVPTTTWTGGGWFTKCLFRDMANGPSQAKMVRNCTLENIGSDALQSQRLVLNTKVDGIRKPQGSDFHPDLLQFYGDFDNVIIYGVEARNIHAQGIFSRGVDATPDKNIAIVNVAIDQKSHVSQWSQSCDHLLMWNVTLLGMPINFRNDPTGIPVVLNDLSVRDSVWQDLRVDPNIVPPQAQMTVFRNNHYIEGALIGSAATGGPVSVSVANDFAPPPGSPLANRVTKPLAPSDASGTPRATPAAIGAVDVR